jgi:hypothetical protein
MYLRERVERAQAGLPDGPMDTLVTHATELAHRALEFADEADAVLSGRTGCPHCASTGDEGLRPHVLFVHPAPLLLFRIAATAQKVASILAATSADLSTVGDLTWLADDELAELLDDADTRRFLEAQVGEERYANVLPTLYERAGLLWPE